VARFSPLKEEARRAWRELRGGALSPARAAAAVAIGLFIGSQPIFGCHTPLILVLCLWFGLDGAIAWIASNVSNPFFAPALLTAEVQVGAYLRTGSLLRLDQEIGRADALSKFAGFMFLGAPVVGPAFGSPAAVGEVLFSDYVLPFEVTSLLLLVAMVGAIVLTRRPKEGEAR